MTSADSYVAAREQFIEVLEVVDDHRRIDATPAWDAHALLSHVVGLATDVSDGHIEGYASEPWTQAQVDLRTGVDRESLLQEWHVATRALRAILDEPARVGLPDVFTVLPVTDLVAHLHDLRETTGVFADGAPGTWEVVAPRRREVLSGAVVLTGRPPLQVRTPEGDDWLVGDGEPVGTVTASRYELWRSLEGRRARESVRAFDWSMDPEPFLACWIGPAFRWPEDSSSDRPVTG